MYSLVEEVICKPEVYASGDGYIKWLFNAKN